jgi:hypothetical protein
VASSGEKSALQDRRAASTKKMRRRTPGMMSDAAEPPDDVDPREEAAAVSFPGATAAPAFKEFWGTNSVEPTFRAS